MINMDRLKIIILNEVTHTHEDKCHIFSHLQNLQK